MENLLMGFPMAYIVDIACLVILLIGALVGAKKGFIQVLFKSISTIVALILAFSLASKVAGWIPLFGKSGSLSLKLENVMLGWNGFNVDVSGEGIASAALENVSLPGFIKDAVAEYLSSINSLPAGTTLASLVAPVLAQFIGLVITGIVIFIVAKLLLWIVQKILTKIVKSMTVVNAVNTIFGALAGAFKVFIVICAILALLSIIPSEGITNFFNQTLVVKYLYNSNPLTKILSMFIKF